MNVLRCQHCKERVLATHGFRKKLRRVNRLGGLLSKPGLDTILAATFYGLLYDGIPWGDTLSTRSLQRMGSEWAGAHRLHAQIQSVKARTHLKLVGHALLQQEWYVDMAAAAAAAVCRSRRSRRGVVAAVVLSGPTAALSWSR